MKLVLVDDDETLLRTLSRRLEQHGHQVHCFSQPQQVQRLADCQADCYLLDLRFGPQSGLDFIAPLRQALPHCRIVLLTGFASIATAVLAVKAGADDYLTKPLDFSLLLAALQGTPQPARTTGVGAYSAGTGAAGQCVANREITEHAPPHPAAKTAKTPPLNLLYFLC